MYSFGEIKIDPLPETGAVIKRNFPSTGKKNDSARKFPIDGRYRSRAARNCGDDRERRTRDPGKLNCVFFWPRVCFSIVRVTRAPGYLALSFLRCVDRFFRARIIVAQRPTRNHPRRTVSLFRRSTLRPVRNNYGCTVSVSRAEKRAREQSILEYSSERRRRSCR